MESFWSVFTGLPRNFNQSQEIFVAVSVSSIAMGGRLDSSNWLKGTSKKTFFWKFPETFKTAVFSKHPLKNLYSDFFRSV